MYLSSQLINRCNLEDLYLSQLKFPFNILIRKIKNLASNTLGKKMVLYKMLFVCFQPDKRPINTFDQKNIISKSLCILSLAPLFRIWATLKFNSINFHTFAVHLLCHRNAASSCGNGVYKSQSLFLSSLMYRQREVYLPNITV